MGIKIYLNGLVDDAASWPFIELPNGIALCCSHCGEPIGDKESNCSVGIIESKKMSDKGPATLNLLASCRKCKMIKGPMLLWKYQMFKQ
ncbi:MAG TPA: hypothetical protein PLB52_00585 [Candidatus Moranbacteria bacterium]|nr:hypothetical protein [Candidatus Moranbacteria bacterium]